MVPSSETLEASISEPWFSHKRAGACKEDHYVNVSGNLVTMTEALQDSTAFVFPDLDSFEI